MNPGLAQGFVRFNTVAHYVLKTLHTDKTRSLVSLRHDIADDKMCLDTVSAALSAALHKLVKYGFIYEVGRERSPVGQHSGVFSLTPPRKPVPKLKPIHGNERSRKYRAQKKNYAPSVFSFRGSIKL